MAERRLLEGLGVGAAEEATYRALLRHGPATLTALAAAAGVSATAIRRMLPRMEDLGLVSRVAGRPLRLVATPPGIAVDVLVARRQEEIAHSRASAALLAAEVAARTGPHPEEVLEVITGRDAVGRRFLQLERTATEELLVLVSPPYAVDISDAGQDGSTAQRARTRGVYGPNAFEVPGMLEHTRRAIAEGEEARLGHVPVKLAVADRRTAILPLVSDGDRAVETALVVHPSGLLDALIGLFEAVWRTAIPLPAALDAPPSAASPSALPGPSALSPSPALSASRALSAAPAPAGDQDADVLTLLAAGLKDDAIARQLGLSPRTVQRRVQALTERLGARTRFHAGVLAARHNLLPPAE
ncbi:sugar-specific transcriptional regulator TrmB/DNA-binding CsgD family transcriptional regulator [Thermocatellispora tengchongensis]|uniref:Sugar-specific transcriptional regulator TrmB/DNA-binding CsgD family transcriptional regulator n=1 Tax=Thermocatellispora tengchongensis TaxID=1073253 RepID=A0A840PDF4_9ACTN|nr:LuxR family transcriptional regulator [Thermocatellispora tengchongensis]MBB5135881.1 sugar-specific transcriptional regulator TrmB/DNA-binding CsgD family transcriptional regulator [Thermocatellispora tengchongensis]